MYNIIIDLDKLAKHEVIMDCFDKTFTYVVEDKTARKVRGFSKPVS